MQRPTTIHVGQIGIILLYMNVCGYFRVYSLDLILLSHSSHRMKLLLVVETDTKRLKFLHSKAFEAEYKYSELMDLMQKKNLKVLQTRLMRSSRNP